MIKEFVSGISNRIGKKMGSIFPSSKYYITVLPLKMWHGIVSILLFSLAVQMIVSSVFGTPDSDMQEQVRIKNLFFK